VKAKAEQLAEQLAEQQLAQQKEAVAAAEAASAVAWAAAPAVVEINGAEGENAGSVNGRFELVERGVYRKVGEADLWLYCASTDQWLVLPPWQAPGWARSVANAPGLPPSSVEALFTVADGKNMRVAELQLHTLSAEEVAEEAAAAEAQAEAEAKAEADAVAAAMRDLRDPTAWQPRFPSTSRTLSTKRPRSSGSRKISESARTTWTSSSRRTVNITVKRRKRWWRSRQSSPSCKRLPQMNCSRVSIPVRGMTKELAAC